MLPPMGKLQQMAEAAQKFQRARMAGTLVVPESPPETIPSDVTEPVLMLTMGGETYPIIINSEAEIEFITD